MPFSNPDNIEVIGSWREDHEAGFVRRGRGAGTGKDRTSMEIKSEPVLFDLDPLMLGAGPAEAIRGLLERQTKDISAVASPSTLKKREQAVEALRRGAAWAVRRYSGGRTGTKPPNQTVRLFNDSGRMAEGYVVRQNPTDMTFTVNVPANRLNPDGFTPAAFEAMLARLRELVPALGDVRNLAASPEVSKAVRDAVSAMIEKAEDRLLAAKLRARQAKVAALRAAFAAGRTLLGV